MGAATSESGTNRTSRPRAAVNDHEQILLRNFESFGPHREASAHRSGKRGPNRFSTLLDAVIRAGSAHFGWFLLARFYELFAPDGEKKPDLRIAASASNRHCWRKSNTGRSRPKERHATCSKEFGRIHKTGRFVEPDQSDASSPAPFAKIFPFPLDPNQIYKPRRPVPTRGVSRSSRTRGGMRWTRQRFARDVMAGRFCRERSQTC